jgi:hypothetical protein
MYKFFSYGTRLKTQLGYDLLYNAALDFNFHGAFVPQE